MQATGLPVLSTLYRKVASEHECSPCLSWNERRQEAAKELKTMSGFVTAKLAGSTLAGSWPKVPSARVIFY